MSARSALTVAVRRTLSGILAVTVAPSRDLTVSTCPSTFSIVPRMRTLSCDSATLAVTAMASVQPTTPNTRRVILFIPVLPKRRRPSRGDAVTTPQPSLIFPWEYAHEHPQECHTFRRRRSLADKISLDQTAQGLRHLRPHAEPALEATDRLVQEHPETVDGAQGARSGGGKQRRFEWCIDQISDHGARWQPRKIDVERGLSGHPKRGRVHEQGCIGEQIVRLPPRHRLHPVAELALQRLSPLEGAVGYIDAVELPAEQAKHDRTRSPPGAQHDRAPQAAIPGRSDGVETGDEPLDVG